MSGLLRRLTRRRPATADETGPAAPASSEPAGAPADTPAESGGDRPVPASDTQATQVLPQTGEQPAVEKTMALAPIRDLPAGIDPSEYAAAPEASAPRGKQRRRLRYLRRVRELMLRDLGGFLFEIHRTAGGKTEPGHTRVLESKVNRLAALDSEVRALERHLATPHETALLREPGIGGHCPECGELHASDAHYCSRCGAPLDAKARARRDADIAAAVQQKAEPAPASGLWAAGPQGQTEQPEEPQSPETSQWLALPRRKAAPETGEAESREAETREPAAAEIAEGETGEVEAAETRDAESWEAETREPATAETVEGETGGAETAEDAPETAEDAPETAGAAEGERGADAPPFEPTPNGRKAEDVAAQERNS